MKMKSLCLALALVGICLMAASLVWVEIDSNLAPNPPTPFVFKVGLLLALISTAALIVGGFGSLISRTYGKIDYQAKLSTSTLDKDEQRRVESDDAARR